MGELLGDALGDGHGGHPPGLRAADRRAAPQRCGEGGNPGGGVPPWHEVTHVKHVGCICVICACLTVAYPQAPVCAKAVETVK